MAKAEFMIRKKFWTFLGAKFHVYKPDGSLIGFCKQKAFKLKEDVRVYNDESMSSERLVIKARSVIDFGASYDVFDARKKQVVGTLRRKGWKSILRDSWEVVDADGLPAGKITEDSAFMAMVRRFLTNLFPQSFHLEDDQGNWLATFKQRFNPFVQKLDVSVHEDCHLPVSLVLAAGVLLVAIEGRQG